ncbi:hypothetical protein F5Y04DRAFT_166070 [Hypomontagnella monticulosa]|nr:hypothetical protein F5Y04DRAFT_166070 [Hypomontagnella monticulosa]
MEPTTDVVIGKSPKISNILDLPDEILKEICCHCLQCDWICLSLVCKRFRQLAAAQLYRNFHIVFPDEDDPFFDSPIDGLAGGLSTFVTSEYNYAEHLREISLDTLSVGERAEAAYKPYLANVSCGKFLNTLLLLTLRKAQSLDAFRWNIRVELSRPIYKALHDITSLRHLHLRLQAGPSLYEAPPPLPYSATQYSDHAPTMPGVQWGNNGSSSLDPVAIYGPPPTLTPSSPSFKPSWKNRASKRPSGTKEPPTISGFKNLETLSVLDIDSLGVVTEIRTCVRNSSSTLRKMKLSFSDSLAMQARKPSADTDLSESEDDEFQVVPLSTAATNFDSNGPAKAFRAQEERKAHEAVLGRIFEIEHFQVKKPHPSAEAKKENETQEQPVSRGGRDFISDIDRVFRRLAAHVSGTTNLRHLEQQEALDTILKAAKKYVSSEEAKAKSNASAQEKPTTDEANPSKETSSELNLDGNADETQQQPNGPSEHPSKTKTVAYDLDPDDIDIESPEEQLSLEAQHFPDAVAAAGTSSSMEQVNSSEEAHIVNAPNEDTEDRIKEAEGGLASTSREAISFGIPTVDSTFDDAPIGSAAYERELLLHHVKKYARDTRGIGLHSLSIHLIPIKASVLGKAIDLHSLRRITLLNVGEQKRFWALMMKENNLKPLPLRKIFTDDVCLQFLQLVSELDSVTEVFMLQRSQKYKPESFAANPGTTIEQIRKFVLKKHLPSLKRLMIKNQADNAWDVDEKTMQLICKKGRVLEELAVIMGMRAIHTFIQYIGGLANLRALQLVSFRTEDTCLSVMRETRRFILDALTHHPEMKLEWLALGDDDRAVRIVRRIEVPKPSKKRSAKGKEPATIPNDYHNIGGHFPVVPVEWDATSESEDDEEDGSVRWPKLELVEPFAFYDIYGVRIFKKEIASGRL